MCQITSKMRRITAQMPLNERFIALLLHSIAPLVILPSTHVAGIIAP